MTNASTNKALECNMWCCLLSPVSNKYNTVNVEIFAQYIFSRILRRALDARKFGVSENYNHNRAIRNKQHMRENLTTQILLLVLGARKFSCAKICTFTVYREKIYNIS